MHYAICNIHPFSPYPDPGSTKTQCIMRIMHYNNMHYENFDCTRLDHYTSQSLLGKNYTSRSLFGKNYMFRSFFGQNYTSGSQLDS